MPTFKEVVQGWFKTGDYPTEDQFGFLFQSIWWKDQKVGLADLDNEFTGLLNTLLGAVSFSYNGVQGLFTVPEGYAIVRCWVKVSDGESTWQADNNADNASFQVPGLVNAVESTPFTFIAAANNAPLVVKFYSEGVDNSIITQVKIYLEKI